MKETILDEIKQQLDRIEAANDELLTAEQAAAFVGVSLDNWRRKHTSVCAGYKIGKRVMFKKSEILANIGKFKVHLSDTELEQAAKKSLGKAV